MIRLNRMIERYEYKNIIWLDVVHPTKDEIRELFMECDLPSSFAGDLTSMTPRTETLAVKNGLKITLDFPVVKRTDIRHPHEVKFIATRSHLITIRFEDIQAIHRFSKEFEVASILETAGKKITGAHFCLALLEHMYAALNIKLDYLESKLQDVEEHIFEDDERSTLLDISNISRRLITFRHTIAPHEEILSELDSDIKIAFGAQYSSQVTELQSSYAHILRRVAALSSTIEDLRNTNNALLNTKQNEVMKILTIMAFITFPLSLFTSMFGMNTVATPILGAEHDFWIIVGIMTFISLGFFAFFKYKKWI